MKKNIVCLTAFILLTSCGTERPAESENKPTEKPITENTGIAKPDFSESEPDSGSESMKNEYSKLNITYVYENGVFLSRETKNLKIGEEYHFLASLSIPFMEPDHKEIKGIKKQEEEYVTITYSYDGKEMENPKPLTQYCNFMIEESKGISFSFLIGKTESGQILAKGNDFAIKTDSIEAGGKSLFFSSGYQEESFASTSFINGDQESALFTYSFFSDKAVLYKNSHRMITFFSNRTQGGIDPVYSTIYQTMMRNLKESGFTLGEGSIQSLYLQTGITKEEVKRRISAYLVTEVEYVDKDTGTIYGRQSKIGKESYSYSFMQLQIPGYQISEEKTLSGTATESKTIRIEERFSGTEKKIENNNIDRSNSYGWSDQSKWLKYAVNLEGDFTMKVSLTNLGASSYTSESANGGDICWRTLLPIVYDSETNDDWVTRFDWYGWMDDNNHDGKRLGTSADYNGGISYVFSYDKDLFPIYKNMDVDITYTRRESTLFMDCLLKPNNVPYKGQCYSYRCTLYGIQTKKLSFALSAEDSSGTIKTVRY